MTWCPPIVKYSWSPAAVALMVVVAGGIGLPGWIIGGDLADRLGRRPSAVFFLLGLAAAEAAFYLGGSALIWPAFAAMVFCQGGKTSVLRSRATELFPIGYRARSAAWLTAGATAGGMFGLAATGALTSVVGDLGTALTIVSGLGIVAAGACYAWLPETAGLELEVIAPEAL